MSGYRLGLRRYQSVRSLHAMIETQPRCSSHEVIDDSLSSTLSDPPSSDDTETNTGKSRPKSLENDLQDTGGFCYSEGSDAKTNISSTKFTNTKDTQNNSKSYYDTKTCPQKSQGSPKLRFQPLASKCGARKRPSAKENGDSGESSSPRPTKKTKSTEGKGKGLSLDDAKEDGDSDELSNPPPTKMLKSKLEGKNKDLSIKAQREDFVARQFELEQEQKWKRAKRVKKTKNKPTKLVYGKFSGKQSAKKSQYPLSESESESESESDMEQNSSPKRPERRKFNLTKQSPVVSPIILKRKMTTLLAKENDPGSPVKPRGRYKSMRLVKVEAPRSPSPEARRPLSHLLGPREGIEEGEPLKSNKAEQLGRRTTTLADQELGKEIQQSFKGLEFPSTPPGQTEQDPGSSSSPWTDLNAPVLSKASNVCVLCGDTFDELLRGDFGKVRQTMNYRALQAFCDMHKRKSATDAWKENGYPDIDWTELEERISRQHKFLQRIIEGGKSYYGRIFKEKTGRSFKSTTMKNFADTNESFSPGYYGQRGLRAMTECLTKRFADSVTAKMKSYTIFIPAVLVPELAVKLIMEDMKVETDEARTILEDSKWVGDLLNEEIGDVVHADDEDDREGEGKHVSADDVDSQLSTRSLTSDLSDMDDDFDDSEF